MAFVFETYLPLNSLIFFFLRFQCRESNAGYEDVKMMTDISKDEQRDIFRSDDFRGRFYVIISLVHLVHQSCLVYIQYLSVVFMS